MFPLLDNRYLYMATDFLSRSMAVSSQLFKSTADMLSGQLNTELYDSSPVFSRLQRAAVARLRLGERLTKSYTKPVFGIKEVSLQNVPVRVTQEIVFETPFCHLLHFKKDSSVRQPRLLLVAPMAGHYATLLRDTVRDSLPFFDVYVTDWMNARDVPISSGGFDMDGYIATLVRCFEHLAPDFHVLGICQSGVPAYAAVCLLESNENARHPLPATLTVMGSPIDVRESPTSVDDYAENQSEDRLEHMSLSVVPEGYPGSGRLVYPGFMQLAAFLSMHPERHQKSLSDAMRHYEDGDMESEEKISSFYAEYFSTMDLTAEFYLQTVRVVFKEALLPQGKMVSRGRLVEPDVIRRTPILAVESEFDDICGVGQTRAALTLARNLPEEKKSYVFLESAGHYGLFNGHRFRSVVLPALVDFTGRFAKLKRDETR